MRQPRNWRKYWKSYLGHVVQGVVVGVALPDAHAIWGVFICYTVYQIVEWLRFRDVVQGIDSTDWPSRDIADFLAGIWVGFFLGLLTGVDELLMKGMWT